MLFVFFWKYVLVKKCVKICVILFKYWKLLFKIHYQNGPLRTRFWCFQVMENELWWHFSDFKQPSGTHLFVRLYLKANDPSPKFSITHALSPSSPSHLQPKHLLNLQDLPKLERIYPQAVFVLGFGICFKMDICGFMS